MSAEEVAAELRTIRIDPGLWEVTSTVTGASGPNLPRAAQARIKGHRRTLRNCITPGQAARPEANFLRIQEDGRCTYRDFSMRDGRVQGEMRCAGAGQPETVTTHMEGRHGPRAYEMRMHMVSTGMPEGGNITIETRTIGRRIGDCPSAAPQRNEGESE